MLEIVSGLVRHVTLDSRKVMLTAQSLMIISSKSSKRLAPLGTRRGPTEESRSQGTSNGTGPTCVASVFRVNPFREFGDAWPATPILA